MQSVTWNHRLCVLFAHSSPLTHSPWSRGMGPKSCVCACGCDNGIVGLDQALFLDDSGPGS